MCACVCVSVCECAVGVCMYECRVGWGRKKGKMKLKARRAGIVPQRRTLLDRTTAEDCVREKSAGAPAAKSHSEVKSPRARESRETRRESERESFAPELSALWLSLSIGRTSGLRTQGWDWDWAWELSRHRSEIGVYRQTSLGGLTYSYPSAANPWFQFVLRFAALQSNLHKVSCSIGNMCASYK